MFGDQHIVEIDDLGEKIELVRQARSLADMDYVALAKRMGIRSDHLAQMLEQKRFRYATLLKFSNALDIPAGFWTWEWSKCKNYLEV